VLALHVNLILDAGGAGVGVENGPDVGREELIGLLGRWTYG